MSSPPQRQISHRGRIVRAFLDGARPWRWAALLALLLSLSSLGAGLRAGDHLLRANFERDPDLELLHTAPWDGFHFFPSDDASSVDHGLGPWWALPGMHARMFRPLTSLTHWVELTLWPSQRWLMHLHSILWYALLCAIAAALYRRLVPGWAAEARCQRSTGQGSQDRPIGRLPASSQLDR